MSEEKKTTEEKKVQRRTFTGVVTSAKADKTIVVEVERSQRHKLYGKFFKQSRRFHVHDEKNAYAEGDTVNFVECRPLSKTKRWRVVESGETQQS